MSEKRLEKVFSYILVKLRIIKKKHRVVNQFCKYCGKEMSYDYHVSDEDWRKLPSLYYNKVLCVHCFCELYPCDLSKVDFEFY